MRINRLDLTRYGKFTDHVIDFGDKIPGRPDIHLIYGPNEAGKSTALAAFLDLLFGIELRTRYNFLHENRTMRIGASLALNGGAQGLVRVKTQQNSLLNEFGQPVADVVLRGDLGSIDREAYRAMFSLDDDVLESGGEDIIASKGDVGQLLYAASAGVADLSQSIAAVKDAADRFYRRGTRTHELSGLKQQLVALKAERDGADMLASDYARLVAAGKLLQDRYDKALDDRSAVQQRKEEILRLQAAQPRLAALRRVRDQLGPLAGLPDAPGHWRDELPGLRQDEVQLATKADLNAGEIATLAIALDAIVIDEAALGVAASMTGLDDLRARHRTAEADIPDRAEELREADRAIGAILGRIGCAATTEPDALIIRAATLDRLNRLIAARSGIEAAVAAARAEQDAAADDLVAATAALARSGGSAVDADERIGRLAVVIAAVQVSDHAPRLRLAQQAYAGHSDTVSHRLRDLNPWVGDIAHLLTMVVPGGGEIERFKRSIAAAESEILTCAATVERLNGELRRRDAELRLIAAIPGVVSDADVSQSRDAREGAWAAHRRTLDTASADTFEAALRRDDALIGDRHTHGVEIARRRQAELDIAALTADVQGAIGLRADAVAALAEVNATIAAAIQRQTPGLPAETSIEQWDTWLQRRAKVVEEWERGCAQQRLIAEAEADGAAARNRLIAGFEAALVPYDKDAGFDDLLAAARIVIDRETAVKALRSAVKQAEATAAKRHGRLVKAQEDDAAWHAGWAAACADCWLGAGGAVPALADVRAILVALADLPAAIEKRAGLAGRIAAMQQDQAAFAAGIGAIAAALAMPNAGRSALETAAAIDTLVKAATDTQADHARLTRDREKAQTLQRGLQRASDDCRKRITEMTQHCGVETLADVAALLDRLQTRSNLRDQANEATSEILDRLRLATIEAAEALLDQADCAALDAEATTLTTRFDDADRQTQALSADLSKARDKIEAIGGDDAVARIESRRRTLQLEIESRAAEYLRLRIGIAAAEQALRLYRDQHRSSMMQNASAAFATISRGAYARLDTQIEKDQEVLVAIGADGGSKLAAELSKGTRFQLYLALRVAGYHEFARSRAALPFIADDIMETFDDFRAEEAFRLFAGMAEVGQVIYLTHHQHLIDIARRICPDVKVHALA